MVNVAELGTSRIISFRFGFSDNGLQLKLQDPEVLILLRVWVHALQGTDLAIRIKRMATMNIYRLCRIKAASGNVRFFRCYLLIPLIRKVFKRLHSPVDIIAQCVRWYLAYSLNLRNLEEMMAERGIVVDHSTLHHWVIRLVPLLDKAFRRHKRAVGCRWRMVETYIKVRGQ